VCGNLATTGSISTYQRRFYGRDEDTYAKKIPEERGGRSCEPDKDKDQLGMFLRLQCFTGLDAATANLIRVNEWVTQTEVDS